MQDQATRAGILTAIATGAPLPYMLDLGHQAREEAHSIAAELVCDLGERSMARKNRQRGRNAGQFIPRKAGRAFRAVLPAWALSAFTVCLAIPGPFDEIAAALAALVLLVVRWQRAVSAWRGGKTHRKAAAR